MNPFGTLPDFPPILLPDKREVVIRDRGDFTLEDFDSERNLALAAIDEVPEYAKLLNVWLRHLDRDQAKLAAALDESKKLTAQAIAALEVRCRETLDTARTFVQAIEAFKPEPTTLNGCEQRVFAAFETLNILEG